MKKSGLTLIELLVTVTVLVTLLSVLFAAVNPPAQFQKIRDGKRKADLDQVKKALQVYFEDNGRYPPSTGTTPGLTPYQLENQSTTPAPWGGTGFSPFMSNLPSDPLSSTTNRSYVYYSDTLGQTYLLYTNLERGSNDPNSCPNADSSHCPNAQNNMDQICSGGSGFCNYGVTSSNTTP